MASWPVAVGSIASPFSWASQRHLSRAGTGQPTARPRHRHSGRAPFGSAELASATGQPRRGGGGEGPAGSAHWRVALRRMAETEINARWRAPRHIGRAIVLASVSVPWLPWSAGRMQLLRVHAPQRSAGQASRDITQQMRRQLTQPGARLAAKTRRRQGAAPRVAAGPGRPRMRQSSRASTDRGLKRGNMCQHRPRCPEWPVPDHQQHESWRISLGRDGACCVTASSFRRRRRIASR